MHNFVVHSADVAKLADALDLGSSGATHESSSLSVRTFLYNKVLLIYRIGMLLGKQAFNIDRSKADNRIELQQSRARNCFQQ